MTKKRKTKKHVKNKKRTLRKKKQKKRAGAKTSASQKIGQFMQQTKPQRQSIFLKNICSDSGVCIAFGIENNKIKQFFNKFTAFDYVVPPITSIGSVSANGFIKEINYQHRGYTASTILKSSQKPSADNLYYEYAVGIQVNQWIPFFPCFVETYGLYGYEDPFVYEWVRDNPTIVDISSFKQTLQLIKSADNPNQQFDEQYKIVCTISQYLAVLIQHIRGAITFAHHLKNNIVSDVSKLAILAQIYIPLAHLTNQFVHNDLHTSNVMLYQPSPGKYITFYYHLTNGKIIQFNSYYIAKIIDYGRSYIPASKYLYESLCQTNECNPKCGFNSGFGWMQKDLTSQYLFTSTLVRNPSSDLRLMASSSLYPNQVIYNERYGTAPLETSGNIQGPLAKIHNVVDAAMWLQIQLDKKIIQTYLSNKDYPPNNKFGDLHIYMDMSKPMEFIPLLYGPERDLNV